MVFQDDLAQQLQELQNVIEFSKGWIIATKNEKWIQLDPGYVLAKATYTKMRQLIIDLASALPTV